MTTPRLLIVDDDSYTRHALATLYAGQGWAVALAATIAQGLVGIDDAPHALILDLNLPDGGGEVILREIRRRSSRTKVAVCSGTLDARQIAAVQTLRPELFLCKPIDFGSLDRMCRAAMAG